MVQNSNRFILFFVVILIDQKKKYTDLRLENESVIKRILYLYIPDIKLFSLIKIINHIEIINKNGTNSFKYFNSILFVQPNPVIQGIPSTQVHLRLTEIFQIDSHKRYYKLYIRSIGVYSYNINLFKPLIYMYLFYILSK